MQKAALGAYQQHAEGRLAGEDDCSEDDGQDRDDEVDPHDTILPARQLGGGS